MKEFLHTRESAMVAPEIKTADSKRDGEKSHETEASASPGRKKIDSVTLIYVPLHLGGSHRGVSMGPAAMRVAELPESIERLGFKIAEEVDIQVPYSVCWWDKQSPAKCVPEIGQVSQDVAEAVEAALTKGTIPITIGGDHSLAIGSIAGVSSYYRKLKQNWGLIWFDAHGDINTPESSESGNVHGMPLAVSLGNGDRRLTELQGFSPKVQPHRSVLIGIRDVDPPEREFIDQSGITPYTMRDIDHLGIGRVTDLALGACGSDVAGLHVSFDIDVIDPDIAPGVSTPSRGGLNYRESHLALTLLAESQLIRAIDIVELNPAFDMQNKTAKLAVELILASLGQRIL
ncbi:MAG: arginase [Candidatus Obscuribacterales bacterium]|nr:arginase [Candidatus Obscuribacterales bacterium]